jgi:hypothetical protein
MEITTREKGSLVAVPRSLPVLHDALRRSVLELIANASHTEASVLCKILRNLRTIFMKVVRIFYLVNLFKSPRFQLDVKYMCYQTELQIPLVLIHIS